MDWHAFAVFLAAGTLFIVVLAALILIVAWWASVVEDLDYKHGLSGTVSFILFVTPATFLIVTLGALAIGLTND